MEATLLARRRLEILARLLELTFSGGNAAVDIGQLRGLVQARQRLLADLPPPPVTGPDGQTGRLEAEFARGVCELLARDEHILTLLEDARARVGRALHQVSHGSQRPAGSGVTRVA